MMHTKTNTKIDIIEKNYQKLENNEIENCVLITTGSFNPIHRSHIKNLLYVKTHLEEHKSQPMNVLAAYISPTHDSYVFDKLGVRDGIDGETRCKLCEEAIQEEKLEDLIAVSRGEIEYNDFIDFDTVSRNLAKFLNSQLYGHDKLLKNPLKIVYVCGLDHFNKCPYVVRLAREENMACAVIYRLGAIEQNLTKLIETTPNIYYINLDKERDTLRDISSTAIRQRYQTLNNTNSDELSYQCVIEYYRNRYSSSH